MLPSIEVKGRAAAFSLPSLLASSSASSSSSAASSASSHPKCSSASSSRSSAKMDASAPDGAWYGQSRMSSGRDAVAAHSEGCPSALGRTIGAPTPCGGAWSRAHALQPPCSSGVSEVYAHDTSGRSNLHRPSVSEKKRLAPPAIRW
eukprot:scaffold201055_cov29-Tisochrysis_lutea.AAC.24